MEECVRMMSQSLRSSGTMKKKAKSVYNQRNLGTIKERKKGGESVEEELAKALDELLKIKGELKAEEAKQT